MGQILSLVCASKNKSSASGRLRPHTRGSAPEPHWRLCPQTPVTCLPSKPHKFWTLTSPMVYVQHKAINYLHTLHYNYFHTAVNATVLHQLTSTSLELGLWKDILWHVKILPSRGTRPNLYWPPKIGHVYRPDALPLAKQWSSTELRGSITFRSVHIIHISAKPSFHTKHLKIHNYHCYLYWDDHLSVCQKHL